MKTLYLLRHAKSSWDNLELTDHQRPLNNRGERDIPRMADWMANKLESPQFVISSDAVRTQLTLAPVQKAWAIKNSQIIFTAKAYHAGPTALLNLIKEADKNYGRLLLVGHNPGLTDLANNLLKSFLTDNIPTSGFVALTFKTDSWATITNNSAELLAYQYPKNL